MDGPSLDKLSGEALSLSFEEFQRVSLELLNAGYALRFQAQGSSMEPIINSGDTVVITPTHNSRLYFSEIVLYMNHDGKYVLHRIIGAQKKENRWFFLLKGDRAARPDGYYPSQAVLGKLSSIESGGKIKSMSSVFVRLAGVWAGLKSKVKYGRLP